MSDDIGASSLSEVADAIREGEVSSRQATELCLERLQRAQPRLNCLITLNAEAALRAADAADGERARGRLRGPLHGVPLAHKDLFYRAGRVCTCGSEIRRDFVPDHTASVLTRLDAAGALDLGTFNLSEFAMGPSGHNVPFGDCRNPWDTGCIAGGSSSGVAAATAARLIYGGLGSDTAGSVRLPAVCCGLVGLKPTQTRISRYGVMPLSCSLDNAGPLTRTARDCARLMTIIAGSDDADPTTSREPVPDYEADLDAGIAGLRIGIPSSYYNEGVDDEVAASLDRSLEVLRSLGARTLAVEVPDQTRVNDLTNIILSAEAATVHGAWMRQRPQDYSPEIRSRLEPGFFISAGQYLEACRLRRPLLEEFVGRAFAEADVLHTPVMPFPVPRIDATRFSAATGLPAFLAAITRFTRSVNFLGLPALSVPCGFAAGGTPLGFQLIGRPFAEALLLRTAHAYQGATDWHRAAPPVH